MDILRNCGKMINHFYVRYSVATELYMVEPWEKITIHILFGAIFCFFWYFNYSIIVNSISQVRECIHI